MTYKNAMRYNNGFVFAKIFLVNYYYVQLLLINDKNRNQIIRNFHSIINVNSIKYL